MSKPDFTFTIPEDRRYGDLCPCGCPFGGVNGHEDNICNLGLGEGTYHGDKPGPNCPGPGVYGAFRKRAAKKEN